MSEQIRLFFTASKPKAAAFYTKAEVNLEEDGWPLASFENEKTGMVELSLYVSAEEECRARQCMAALAELPESTIQREILPQIDWVKHSLDGLKPVQAGRFFVHGAHDRHKIRAGDIGIEIEANRAFGTGHHGTTAGCLEMLEKQVIQKKPQNILDIGTGSGILAIAAAKLGVAHILATDNDPIAVEIATENIALNGVESAVTILCAEGFIDAQIAKSAPFDLIIANILAGPLVKMAADMKKALKPGGVLILSGILAKQSEAVTAAYAAQRLKLAETLPKEEWVTLLFHG